MEPTAELSEGQEDPFDYELVSPIVEDILEDRTGPKTLVKRFENQELGQSYPEKVYETHDIESFEEVVDDTYDRFRKASFKRKQAPPVIAVSERAFGTDFREPIIDGWRSS